jgi:hypothetical protein
MKTHDWTGVEWGEEFGITPKALTIQGEGNLSPGDEVIVRFKVDTVDRYWDETDQFWASLIPIGEESVRVCSRGIPGIGDFAPAQSIWQRLINFFKRSV